MKVRVLKAGSCKHPECVAMRGGGLSPIEFPALCGLIEHPSLGYILYDTGYSPQFFHATAQLPELLYRLVVPVDLPAEQTLIAQLAALGIQPADIALVIVSHYHGDHIGGLRDFPNARFIASKADTEQVLALRGQRIRATSHGIVPGLLPDDYQARLSFADDCRRVALPSYLAPFADGFDLLGDGQLIAVPLPGHSAGQLGLFIPDGNGRPWLFAADACWNLPAAREGRLPSWLAMRIQDDPATYRATFAGLGRIARQEPAVAIQPSHCLTTWQQLRDKP